MPFNMFNSFICFVADPLKPLIIAPMVFDGDWNFWGEYEWGEYEWGEYEWGEYEWGELQFAPSSFAPSFGVEVIIKIP
jgi:hypothetical protein